MLTLGLIQDISDAVSGTAVGGFLFAPNSLLQYGQIREHLVYLMMGDHVPGYCLSHCIRVRVYVVYSREPVWILIFLSS